MGTEGYGVNKKIICIKSCAALLMMMMMMMMMMMSIVFFFIAPDSFNLNAHCAEGDWNKNNN